MNGTMSGIELTLDNGKKYRFARMACTPEARAFRRVWEKRKELPDSDLLEVADPVLRQSLRRHHSPDEVEEAMSALDVYGTNNSFDRAILALFGVPPELIADKPSDAADGG